jgi:hypothetical protein
MNIKILSALFVVLFCVNENLISQNAKFNKDAVFIDKVKKYDFIRTKKGGLTGLSNVVLKDLDGKDIIIINDTTLYYKRLPNELEDRGAIKTNYIYSPEIDKTILVSPIISYNIRKDIVKELDKLEFFKSGNIDENLLIQLAGQFGLSEFEKTLDNIEKTNTERFIVAQLVEKEFGPHVARKPGLISHMNGKIFDGGLTVASYVLDGKGSYAATYKIISSKGYHVANLTIIPSESRANVRFLIDQKNERRHWFKFIQKEQTPPTKEEMNEYFFDECAKYIIENGFL